ncbi:MAG TPA: methyltransferase [Xanthobacteraceae bacterium]|jgi:tRNA1(Val) A37 N6-methylase TrmN6|nr:methyltransferase [Xanthobacteraceae bacterium]
MTAGPGNVSDDAVLGGRLKLLQPRRGHRFGHDAILLAAAVDASAGETAIDLGAGVGAAGLALARRVEGLAVTLVELDPGLAALARENAERNELAERVHTVCLDVTVSAAEFTAAGLAAASADHVLMNPPFNPRHNPSPDAARRTAHVGADDTLRHWLTAAARLLRPKGTVTLIWRADGLADVTAALAPDFGAMGVLPVHPKPGAAAIRIIVRAVKGAGGGFTTLPSLVLASADGAPSAEAESIMRHGSALSLTAA